MDVYRATASNNQKSSASEVCVRTSANGWVVGRRANESHREFFVLIDDKSGSITDVQGALALVCCHQRRALSLTGDWLQMKWTGSQRLTSTTSLYIDAVGYMAC